MKISGLLKKISAAVFLLPAAVPAVSAAPAEGTLPNVIVVIADDLGYGDVSAYGSSLKTPNFDRLAENGLRFTRGYSASATSSPSRYGLLTGIYPWRGRVDVLPGDSPLIVPTDKPTVATMFRSRGYATAAVGKWHLGLGKGNSDWNKFVSPGPNDIGFDRSFIMAATNDRVPCVYFSDGYVVGLDPADPIQVSYRKNFPGEPTGKTHPELLKLHPSPNHGHDGSIVNGVSRIGFMKGGNAARWVDEKMADVLSAKAHEFIRENKGRPFFLYYALHQPHVPRVPAPEFAGKSGLGPRGDVILEADAQVGALLDLLEKENLSEKTIVIFTSDNGPVLNDGYADDAVRLAAARGYNPAGALRGGKYSLFEGGTRVPFIVSWPGKIAAGTSDVPVSQLDLFASLAALVGGAGYAVYAGSENLELAMQVATYFMTPDILDEMCYEGMVLPMTKELAEGAYLTDDKFHPDNKQFLLDVISGEIGEVSPLNNCYSVEWYDNFANNIDAVWNGSTSAEDYIKEVAPRMQELYDMYNKNVR